MGFWFTSLCQSCCKFWQENYVIITVVWTTFMSGHFQVFLSSSRDSDRAAVGSWTRASSLNVFFGNISAFIARFIAFTFFYMNFGTPRYYPLGDRCSMVPDNFTVHWLTQLEDKLDNSFRLKEVDEISDVWQKQWQSSCFQRVIIIAVCFEWTQEIKLPDTDSRTFETFINLIRWAVAWNCWRFVLMLVNNSNWFWMKIILISVLHPPPTLVFRTWNCRHTQPVQVGTKVWCFRFNDEMRIIVRGKFGGGKLRPSVQIGTILRGDPSHEDSGGLHDMVCKLLLLIIIIVVWRGKIIRMSI